ncbi:MAG: hypothetical protein M3R36_03175 [Bacteroidota bacterium]|nr:hypothetical protein [Bacteroidota bacterium]
MKKLFIPVLLTGLLISACNEKKPETTIKKDSTEKMTIKKDTTLQIKKEMKTKSGKIFTINESKPAFTVSDYMISGTGFMNSSDTIKYSQKDPMTTAMLADLDKNGFEELYIITKTGDTEYFMNVIGVASPDDQSLKEIKIQEIAAADMENTGKFSGYKGMDSVYISGSNIIREFPVYKGGDSMSNPTGGKRKIIYTLKPAGDSYQLVITGSEDMK